MTPREKRLARKEAQTLRAEVQRLELRLKRSEVGGLVAVFIQKKIDEARRRLTHLNK